MSGPRWLVLWDIDGTLLIDASETHARVVWDTIQAVHGIERAEQGMVGGRAGMTDGQICREILTAAGVEHAQIDEHVPTVVARASSDYEPGDLRAAVGPGMPELLADLADRGDVAQALVTGNFEQIARRKIDAGGIGGWFDPRLRGGFGSDNEAREHLPAIARARAGRVLRADRSPWPADRTVIVGDTPRDIACARYDGSHVVAITTGPHGADELAAADAVVADATELRTVLWRMLDAAAPSEETS